MHTVTVKVQSDFLERMSTAKPVAGIAELIWNALDAESTKVEVYLVESEIGGIEKVVVKDNGHGFNFKDATIAFENLGGSWKKNLNHSKNGSRKLHGKKGQGRFLAFSVGDQVVWKTICRDDGKLLSFEVGGSRKTLGSFEISDPIDSVADTTGTTVEIEGIAGPLLGLATTETHNLLTEIFAIYLRNYQDVKIFYNGNKLEPSDVQECVFDKDLDPIVLSDGSIEIAHLTTIEWKIPIERCLHLCDPNGFSLHEIRPNIQAPGFNFTAYLQSQLVRKIEESSGVFEMNPDVLNLVDKAKTELRNYFRSRVAERAASVVEEWKQENIYPYPGNAKNIIEETERQVFDVCALSINDYMPGFEDLDSRNKKLTFSLLKQAIEESPQSVQRIFDQVLDLPREKQEEFAQLLEKTTLSAIINASKVVADRIEFLKGLELLLYNDESREQLKERSQLHRILVSETWIFGEEFNLTVDDQSLTEVLRKHLKELGRETSDLDTVVREDGKTGIVDLMLSRRIPLPKAEQRQHLIIELKRPKQPIDPNVLSQIKSYAFAVSADERFKNTDTKWIFWAISNDMTDAAIRESTQAGRPTGMIYQSEDQSVVIWAKTWSQVLESCRGRLEFFRTQLEYSADQDSGLQYLRTVHEKLLPKVFAREIN